MPEHEIYPVCQYKFDDTKHRLDKIEHALDGNAKPGLIQDVAELKRDVEDVCKSNDRIETTLDKFVKDFHSSNEGDKNRGTELKKIVLQNGGQVFLAVIQLLMLYWFWSQTGVTP